MLVICNGVFKGGSNWILHIIQELSVFDEIPSKYRNPGWQSPSFDDSFLLKFDELNFFKSGDFYCKQHMYRKEIFRDIARNSDIRTLNIIRDIRDMVVSAYFHDKRKGLVSESMELAAFFKGGNAEQWLQRIIEYQRFWHLEEKQPPHLMSYERLHYDFEFSIRDLLEYLSHPELAYSDELGARLMRATDWNNLNEKGPGTRLPFGKIGTYRNYLTDEQEAWIKGFAVSMGYDEIKGRIRHQFPKLEHFLRTTDIGLGE